MVVKWRHKKRTLESVRIIKGTDSRQQTEQGTEKATTTIVMKNKASSNSKNKESSPSMKGAHHSHLEVRRLQLLNIKVAKQQLF
eukprot:scaffold11026_cov308-Chaetoceros_neogracile.AAC.1